jgi:hypothetical protein
MTDWSGALARASWRHLEICGSNGSAGSRQKNAKQFNGIKRKDPGTSLPNSVVLRVPENNPPDAHLVTRTTGTTAHSRMVPDRAKQEDKQERLFAEPGTSHTIGTTVKDYGRTSPNDLFVERAAIVERGVPCNWAVGFARLDIAERPREFTETAWRQLIEDTDLFSPAAASRSRGVGTRRDNATKQNLTEKVRNA